MSTSATAARHGDGGGLRVVGAAAALLAAAAVLFVGVSASERETAGSSDVPVEPGKVSVVGNAKVRRWEGQTFSIEVPLEWVKTFSGTVNRQNASDFQRHAWALPAAGVAADDERLGVDDWGSAKSAAEARMRVEIAPYETTANSRLAARKLASDLAGDSRYAYGDVGTVTLAGADGAVGRTAWRLNVTTAGNRETHYFFSTCDAGKPREAWHITFDRRSVRDMQPTLESMLASIDTTYPAASAKGSGCAG